MTDVDGLLHTIVRFTPVGKMCRTSRQGVRNVSCEFPSCDMFYSIQTSPQPASSTEIKIQNYRKSIKKKLIEKEDHPLMI